jgi:hypothetical protein
MTAATQTHGLVERAVVSADEALVSVLEVVTVAACLALFLAFAQGLWIEHARGTVIVCVDAPEKC